MSGEKRFRGSLFGYKKRDVNLYLEKIVSEYDIKLTESEEEIALLRKQLKELKAKNDELSVKSDEKGVIGLAIISAHESAEKIIEEARLKAIAEKKRLDSMLESDRERIVDMKKLLKSLKDNTIQVLKHFEGEVDALLEDNNDEEDIQKIS